MPVGEPVLDRRAYDANNGCRVTRRARWPSGPLILPTRSTSFAKGRTHCKPTFTSTTLAVRQPNDHCTSVWIKRLTQSFRATINAGTLTSSSPAQLFSEHGNKDATNLVLQSSRARVRTFLDRRRYRSTMTCESSVETRVRNNRATNVFASSVDRCATRQRSLTRLYTFHHCRPG